VQFFHKFELKDAILHQNSIKGNTIILPFKNFNKVSVLHQLGCNLCLNELNFLL
jgi:hypothetical protein